MSDRASKRANGQAISSVLTSGFLLVLDHSAVVEWGPVFGMVRMVRGDRDYG